jgi:hypothetical protein
MIQKVDSSRAVEVDSGPRVVKSCILYIHLCVMRDKLRKTKNESLPRD